MTGAVATLVPNRALAPTHADIAERLRAKADRVQAGEFPELERVVLVLDHAAASPDSWVYGQRTTAATMVGVLEFAKLKEMGLL